MSTLQSKPEEFEDAAQLIDLLCDDLLLAEKQRELDALICRFADVRKYYILAMSLQAELFAEYAAPAAKLPGDPSAGEAESFVPSMHDSLIMEAITDDQFDSEQQEESELNAPATAAAVGPVSLRLPVEPVKKRFAWRRVAAIVILGISAALIAVLGRHLSHRRSDRSVAMETPAAFNLATIDLSLHPILAAGSTVDSSGTVHPGKLDLQSGTARLITSSGVEIVLQSPIQVSMQQPGRITLDSGRLTVRAPHTAPGFTVVTPSAIVTDLGTEFGVSTLTDDHATDARTKVVVFEGSTRVTQPDSTSAQDGQLVSAGQAYSISSAGTRLVQGDGAEPFIRTHQFDQQKVAMHSTLANVMNPDVLGYSLFDSDFDRFATAEGFASGLTDRPVLKSSPVQIQGDSVAQGSPEGRRLTLSGRQSAIVNIDTSPASKLAKAGYLGPDGFIEASGKTLYLAWKSTMLKSDRSGFGGLSLADGDSEVDNEYIFAGQTAYFSSAYECQAWKQGRQKSLGIQRFKVKPSGFPVDSQTHLWVMKIEFLPGNDRISLFFDAPVSEPAKPDVLVTSVDLRFNRLRLSCGEGCVAQYARIMLGQSYPSVVPKD